jgi:hypothetical protein
MKQIIFFSLLISLFSCGGSQEVEVGQKTTMVVNPVYDAGTVVKGEVIKAKFVVQNTGKYPLVIADVQGSCTCTVAEKPKKPIKPGQSATIQAEVDTEKTATGKVSKSVRIVANTEPSVTEVVVKGNVKR